MRLDRMTRKASVPETARPEPLVGLRRRRMPLGRVRSWSLGADGTRTRAGDRSPPAQRLLLAQRRDDPEHGEPELALGVLGRAQCDVEVLQQGEEGAGDEDAEDAENAPLVGDDPAAGQDQPGTDGE
jgi:hypothetical protein